MTDDDVKNIAGFDPRRLNLVGRAQQLFLSGPWSIVILRKGRLVREWYGIPSMPSTSYDIWSCTKSVTSIAIGMLLEEAKEKTRSNDKRIRLDSLAYDFIPEGRPLTDRRKEDITIRHLLCMTSGIAGENQGIHGLAVGQGAGEFEFALGKCPNRFGLSTAKLTRRPGDTWDYSDPAFAHLSLLFYHASGREIADYMQEKVFRKIGVINSWWSSQGGAGFIGPHTSSHTGLHLTGRNLARIGFLLLNKGMWQGRQIVPPAWITGATRSSQKLNPNYGYGFWTNSARSLWPTLPNNAFALRGYASNRCYVVPSFDLVVARVGYGPFDWPEDSLITQITDTIID